MIEKRILPNGVRLVLDPMEHVRTASLGIWVGNGSRHEPAELNGISHFIEHMVFKGTEKRTARHIAIAFDAIGGQVNAFTTKECTCFYMKALDSRLQTGASILADMFLNSQFAAEDLELERGVVLEEIDMYEDTPEDVAVEKLAESCFAGSPLGMPILGTEETLSAMTSETLHSYVREYYRPDETVVALAGSYTEEDVRYLSDLFGVMQPGAPKPIGKATYHRAIVTRKKKIEQNHIAIGYEMPARDTEGKYAIQMMNAILGGGMSSRLFQTVREQNGLCYTVYSDVAAYEDTGLLTVYTALGKEQEEKAIRLILDEIEKLRQDGPTRDELNRCREQAKTGVLMAQESTSARMNHIGKSELALDRVMSIQEILDGYDAVSEQAVQAFAQRLLKPENASICAVGKVSGEECYQKLFR